MPILVTITGPIAAGKSTVAARLAALLSAQGRSAVIADVDDVAEMVAGPGAGATGLWPAAHAAHGAMVAQWLRSEVDAVIAIGPFHTEQEQHALHRGVPAGTPVLRVLLDADVATTWERATADETRGLSREHGFHHRAHALFRERLAGIAADLVLDSTRISAEEAARTIRARLPEASRAPAAGPLQDCDQA